MTERRLRSTLLSSSYDSPAGTVTPAPRAAWDRLLHLLFPAPCLSCERPLPTGRRALALCLPCRGRLLRCRACHCAGCGLSLAPSPGTARYQLCTACSLRPPACRRIWTPWIYGPPLAEVLQAFKFGRLDYLGRDLAESALEEIGCVLEEAEVVVPVPLHWRRRMERRFNQAEAIAQPLARALRRPMVQALRRRQATRPQTSLPRRERLRNPRRAFVARRRQGQRVAGRRVLLVDDVLTTGATLEAAARSLQRAGAREVLGLAIARSLPLPEPGAVNPGAETPRK
ncbi:MAG: ComF family protein [Acidobacteriota bacterium]